ncbi:MAG TPA: response regulator transcription factor [Acidimicrobiales bacterium]|jgi:DNA-binding NarL/FixJ family response regulator|nr:response regulator transcription factor [Acidimicrobiales bacterium]
MLGALAKRVVIADNDAAWVELVRTDLSLEGHDVVATCNSGEDALAACRLHEPNVLVVDERMPPGMNGIEVARQLRETHPGITVIVFTNYDEEEIIKGAADVGAVFVMKGNLRALRAALTLD